jgi:DNA-binding response OmpR family regulator
VHSDGKTALDAVETRKPDLIILDVMLPNRSGYDILNDIRSQAKTALLPVLMLTARGQKKDRDLAEKLGVSRFMTKPFSNGEVLAAVRDLVTQ